MAFWPPDLSRNLSLWGYPPSFVSHQSTLCRQRLENFSQQFKSELGTRLLFLALALQDAVQMQTMSTCINTPVCTSTCVWSLEGNTGLPPRGETVLFKCSLGTVIVKHHAL